MIDIKFLRENPEAVKENIRKKFQDDKLPLVDEVIVLDEERRKAQQEADNIKAEKNKLSKQIGALMAQGKKEEAEDINKQVAKYAEKLAWYHLLKNTEADIDMKQALVGWKLTVKKIGKGTGKSYLSLYGIIPVT